MIVHSTIICYTYHAVHRHIVCSLPSHKIAVSLRPVLNHEKENEAARYCRWDVCKTKCSLWFTLSNLWARNESLCHLVQEPEEDKVHGAAAKSQREYGGRLQFVVGVSLCMADAIRRYCKCRDSSCAGSFLEDKFSVCQILPDVITDVYLVYFFLTALSRLFSGHSTSICTCPTLEGAMGWGEIECPKFSQRKKKGLRLEFARLVHIQTSSSLGHVRKGQQRRYQEDTKKP